MWTTGLVRHSRGGDRSSGSALADNSRLLGVAESNGRIRLIATRTGKDAGVLPGRGRRLWAMAAAPHGPWLAVEDIDPRYTLTLWNLATRTRRVLALPDGKPDGLVITPDGNRLTASFRPSREHAPGTVRTWDTRTGRTTANPPSFPTQTYRPQLAFSPDAKTLAVGTDMLLYLIDARTGRTHHAVSIRQSPYIFYGVASPSFAFSPDSRTIASARADGYVQILNVSTGKVQTAMAADSAAATAFAFSPDGRSLAVGDTGGTVRIWDLTTAHVRATYHDHDGSGHVSLLAFSPDGTFMASGESVEDTGRYSGRTRLWHTSFPDPAHAIAQICRAVGRNLTEDELNQYLPDRPASPICPS